jgi:uncharacterized protein (TIGR02001 family)
MGRARRSRTAKSSQFRCLWAVCAILAAAVAAPARAEVAASLAIESDYQLRGVSLSNGQPVASLTVAYDHSSGVYGDVAVIGVSTRRLGVETLGYVAHLGYARRLSSGVSLDVGVRSSRVSSLITRRVPYDYTEAYVGLSKGDVSGHIYLSQDYIGDVGATAYVDLEGALRPARHWRVFGHVGVLAPLSQGSKLLERRTQIDLRAGVARELGNLELHAAFTATSTAPHYPRRIRNRRDALTVGAVYYF